MQPKPRIRTGAPAATAKQPDLVSQCFRSPIAFRVFSAWVERRCSGGAVTADLVPDIVRQAGAESFAALIEVDPRTGRPTGYPMVGSFVARLKGMDGPGTVPLPPEGPLDAVRRWVVATGLPMQVTGHRRVPGKRWLAFEAIYLRLCDGPSGASDRSTVTLMGALVPLGYSVEALPLAGGETVQVAVDRHAAMVWTPAWKCWTCVEGPDSLEDPRVPAVTRATAPRD